MAEVVDHGDRVGDAAGRGAGEVLDRIAAARSAAQPSPFAPSSWRAPVSPRSCDFDAEQYFPENKTLRLMNRDAQMAVVAARLAMADARHRARRVISGRGDRPVRRDGPVGDAGRRDRPAGASTPPRPTARWT